MRIFYINFSSVHYSSIIHKRNEFWISYWVSVINQTCNYLIYTSWFNMIKKHFCTNSKKNFLRPARLVVTVCARQAQPTPAAVQWKLQQVRSFHTSSARQTTVCGFPSVLYCTVLTADTWTEEYPGNRPAQTPWYQQRTLWKEEKKVGPAWNWYGLIDNISKLFSKLCK